MNTTDDYFKPILLKLGRAKQQFVEISDLTNEVFNESNIQISAKIRDDKKGYEFITNDYSNGNILDQLSLRVGEYIHNLRSTLDNLIFAVARIKADPPSKPKDLSFPICNNEENYRNQTKKIFYQIPSFLELEILKLQPFIVSKDPKNVGKTLDSLSIVQNLNNSDKHRVPIILQAIFNEIRFDGSFEFENDNAESFIDEKSEFAKFHTLKPNTAIFEFKTLEKIEKMEMKFNIKLEIAIEYPTKNLNIEILKNIYNDVCFVVEKLISITKQNIA
jgi:hypothetical protein